MKDNNFTQEKRDKIIQYYKNKKLLFVGLNDSQGVNTTTTFFKKGLLDYLALALTTEELTPTVINAFSLTMNKTEHIDYFFKNNLSLEEIKISQVYSAVSALEKVMVDFHLPKLLGQVGNVYKMVYPISHEDKNIKLTTSLKRAEEPIMIYSSGVNNLMREVGNNPFQIKGDYQKREKSPRYNYTLEQSKNPSTLIKVMDGIKKNYETILSINHKTDIYTLGAYIPKSLEIEELNIFRELIIAYNEELKNLCQKYGTTFIDTEKVGKTYNKSEVNFHITSAGHNALANYILNCIYENKENILKRSFRTNIPYEFTNNASAGVMEDILTDYEKSIQKAISQKDYFREREFEIAKEHEREAEIFQKVIKARKR